MTLKELSYEIKKLTHDQLRHLFIMSNMDELVEDIQYIKKKATLEDVMKDELLEVAKNKYTLIELETKLGGNKFTL